MRAVESLLWHWSVDRSRSERLDSDESDRNVFGWKHGE